MPPSPQFGRRATASQAPAQKPEPAQPAAAPEALRKTRNYWPSPISALCLAGIAIVVVMFATQSSRGHYYAAEIAGWFDPRPVKTVLLIGNSRTFYNDLPGMVRRIADSAHSPVRLSITMLAWGGASFEENWNDEGVRAALQKHWDAVILQAESRAIASEENRASFSTYGRKLIAAGRQGGSPVAVIVNWAYGESIYSDAPPGTRDDAIGTVEQITRGLADQADARVIDTCAVWERIHAAHPRLPLYEDGNHPTVAGSYISALMIYRFLSGGSVERATYLPDGVDAQAAEPIKRIASQ
jgi:lysophospholipase L1-like esterase